MKKLFLLSAAVAVLASVPLRAADISIGASTWYATWKTNDSVTEMKLDPTWFYGPAIAVKFNNDFTLNSIFLYGTYDVEIGSNTIDWHRYDSDTSLSYRLNNYLRLFGGIKYLGYKIDIPQATAYFNAFGPAAGISAVFPLINNFFILGNISGMYLRGKKSQEGEDDTKHKVTGYNTAASVAYYIAPASVTLSLGGRYQYFKMVNVDDSTDYIKNKFYGLTAAATYSFRI